MGERDIADIEVYCITAALAITGLYMARRQKDKPRIFLQVGALLCCIVGLVNEWLQYLIIHVPSSDSLNITGTIFAIVGLCGTALFMVMSGLRGLWRKESRYTLTVVVCLAHVAMALVLLNVVIGSDEF